MSPPVQVITATVHSGLLQKTDRLFRNDDYSVLSELIQNARRAGATRVDFTIEKTESEEGSSTITIQDNGGGITDFQNLLTLGESGWTEDTQTREDPAGMGFFSLCRSAVEVHSGNQHVRLTPAIFAGKASATVEYSPELVAGTRIRFTRASCEETLTKALERSAQFCPVTVTLGGRTLPQQDFLEGAL